MEQGSSDLVKYIAEHYGAEHQLPILQEECAELIKAVSKLLQIDDGRASEYIRLDAGAAAEVPADHGHY